MRKWNWRRKKALSYLISVSFAYPVGNCWVSFRFFFLMCRSTQFVSFEPFSCSSQLFIILDIGDYLLVIIVVVFHVWISGNYSREYLLSSPKTKSLISNVSFRPLQLIHRTLGSDSVGKQMMTVMCYVQMCKNTCLCVFSSPSLLLTANWYLVCCRFSYTICIVIVTPVCVYLQSDYSQNVRTCCKRWWQNVRLIAHFRPL